MFTQLELARKNTALISDDIISVNHKNSLAKENPEVNKHFHIFPQETV